MDSIEDRMKITFNSRNPQLRLNTYCFSSKRHHPKVIFSCYPFKDPYWEEIQTYTGENYHFVSQHFIDDAVRKYPEHVRVDVYYYYNIFVNTADSQTVMPISGPYDDVVMKMLHQFYNFHIEESYISAAAVDVLVANRINHNRDRKRKLTASPQLGAKHSRHRPHR